MSNIYVNTNAIEKEINLLKNEKDNLMNINKKIKETYNQLRNHNLEGTVINEIYNNYEYGIECTNNLINIFEEKIKNLQFTNNKYLSTIEKISEKIGEKNG